LWQSLWLVKACGFQVCQFVTFVPGGESLITAGVNTMASSLITMTFNAHKAGSIGVAGMVSAN